MYGADPLDGKYWIYRLMIDKEHQRKGFGKAAMYEVIKILKSQKGCESIAIAHLPENRIAEKLYIGLGFTNTGEIIQGEIIKSLQL
jgi:diamine N-acetyltransferase